MPEKLKVFVSYSHQDAEYLKEDSLLGFLKGWKRTAWSFGPTAASVPASSGTR